MRCLALAQAWQDAGMEVVFAMRSVPENLVARLAAENMRLEILVSDESSEIGVLAGNLGTQWIVLDGYHLDGVYQKHLKSLGFQLLVLDDYGSSPAYYADIILNPNTSRTEIYEGKGLGAQLLLGSPHALLRREFLSVSPSDLHENISRILLTFGGSDPRNVTLRVAKALKETDFELLVVVGPANPYLSDLEALAKESRARFLILRNSENMAAVMTSVDLAIAAASVTCFELAYLGVPQILITTADNQKYTTETLAEAGACVALGFHDQVTDEQIRHAVDKLTYTKRQTLRDRGHALVDGQGIQRILREVDRLSLSIRHATPGDMQVVFDWANDRMVREASFSSEPILREDHERWFAAKLAAKDCLFYIVEKENGQCAAQVRFDLHNNAAVISVSVEEGCRGGGFGTAVIRLASLEFRRTYPLPVHAYIRPDNIASIKAFRRVGFREQSRTQVNGSEAEHLILSP